MVGFCGDVRRFESARWHPLRGYGVVAASGAWNAEASVRVWVAPSGNECDLEASSVRIRRVSVRVRGSPLARVCGAAVTFYAGGVETSVQLRADPCPKVQVSERQSDTCGRQGEGASEASGVAELKPLSGEAYAASTMFPGSTPGSSHLLSVLSDLPVIDQRRDRHADDDDHDNGQPDPQG